MKSLRFYWILYTAALKARTEYRVDFVLSVVTAVMTQLSALSFYWIVFAQSELLGGWAGREVLLLFGIAATGLAVSELCFNGIWQLPHFVVGGEFDRLLVYPVRSLTFLLLARPELHAFGNLVSGAVMVGIAWSTGPVPTVAYLLLPVWVLACAVIYTAALVLLGCLQFRIVGPWSHHFMVAHQLLNATRYPVHIYPRWFRYTLLFAFPIATPVFLPGLWLRGEGSLAIAAVAPVAAALISATIAYVVWERAIRRYQSTGS